LGQNRKEAPLIKSTPLLEKFTAPYLLAEEPSSQATQLPKENPIPNQGGKMCEISQLGTRGSNNKAKVTLD